MNKVHAQLDNEEVKPHLGELTTEFAEHEYRIFIISKTLDMTATDEQLELIFQELDKKLHAPTMTSEYMINELSEKEDIIYDLQQELNEAKELVEMYQDNMPIAM